jgi:hypothetical protein
MTARALRRVKAVLDASPNGAWFTAHHGKLVRATVVDLRAVVALAERAAEAERRAENHRHVASQRGRALEHYYRIAGRVHAESLLDGEPDTFVARLRAACEDSAKRMLAPPRAGKLVAALNARVDQLEPGRSLWFPQRKRTGKRAKR